jgi:hypothetical protein
MARERKITLFTRIKHKTFPAVSERGEPMTEAVGEFLELDMPGGKALAVFTSARRASEFVRAAGLPVTEETGLLQENTRWAPLALPLHMAEEYIREDNDSKHVVIDPLPNGKRGRRLTIFQAMVELS